MEEKFYCVKCKKAVISKVIKERKFKNGAVMLQGQDSEGHKLYKFAKKKR
jgi:hypothetical protein